MAALGDGRRPLRPHVVNSMEMIKRQVSVAVTLVKISRNMEKKMEMIKRQESGHRLR